MISRSKIKIHLKAIALLLLLLLATWPAKADIFKLGEIGLWNTDENLNYQFTVTGPIAAFDSADPLWPGGCSAGERIERATNGRTSFSYTLSCRSPLRAEQTILINWQLDGVRYSSNVAGLIEGLSLVPKDGSITVPISPNQIGARPLKELGKNYISQGIRHIWLGWDHLVFVLSLCFLFNGRMLIGLVTVFTIGHSITLGLSYFELVRLAMPPIEALIALSIVFMAREAIKQKSVPAVSVEKTIVTSISFIGLFGLLHGLGFASALSELGAAPEEKLKALLFFNVGVEIGQIAFIAVIVPLLVFLKPLKFAATVRYLTLTSIGCLGGYWTFERLAGF